ncbi:MAG: protein jag [Clostridia bacterium]|nr:protein jag [Oscillospiraceae bacterium]MBQ6701642.1 protein jag [Clostridia bacterium]
MIQEVIVFEKTIEEAIKKGLKELGVPAEKAQYEVLENPKKGFLGFGEAPAKVRVYCEVTTGAKAVDFVKTLVKNMELGVEVKSESPNGKDMKITLEGESACALIGHHGETLDAVQYLANLSANKGGDDDKEKYCKVTVDIENYRAKREETLRTLARRMANRVLKNGRNMTLEPMNPYERRIIHSEVQNIEGVSTYSIGSDDNRKIVICLEDKVKHKK